MDHTTLRDQAIAAEGTPTTHPVRVELLDTHGNIVEWMAATADTSRDELARWAGDYVCAMVAEGMAGSIRWTRA